MHIWMMEGEGGRRSADSATAINDFPSDPDPWSTVANRKAAFKRDSEVPHALLLSALLYAGDQPFVH